VVVSAVSESGNTIDVYRRGDCGSTESNANSNSDALYIIGNAQLDGFTYGADVRFYTRSSKYNQTQIFTDAISVADSYEKIPKFGIPSEAKNQLKMKQLRLAKLLERAVLYGGTDATYPEGNASYPRKMCGIIAKGSGTIDIQTNTASLSSAEITEDNVNGYMQAIFDAGGKPDTIICNSFNKRTISSWMQPYRKSDMEETKYGGVVDSFKNDFGVCSIILDRYMLQSDVIILKKDNFKIGAYRPFKVLDIPKTADKIEQVIVGEYTCMMYNEEHSYYVYSTSTS
jgi:hypothetical protein